MKTPRVEDFDPNAQERKLKSPLEGMPVIEKSKPKGDEAVTPAHTLPNSHPHHEKEKPPTVKHEEPLPVPPVRDVRPVLPVPPVPPVKKRVMKQRHPFDIYQDQYEALQQLALEERKQGGVGSMSAMVREAIDKLIAERKHK